MTVFAQGVWILLARYQHSSLVACRSKLSIAQSRANQRETECSSLQDDNAGLSCQVARAEGHLVVTQAKLRCAVLCCLLRSWAKCLILQMLYSQNKRLTLFHTAWTCRLVIWATLDTTAMECTDLMASAHHRDSAYASQHLPNSLPLFCRTSAVSRPKFQKRDQTSETLLKQGNANALLLSSAFPKPLLCLTHPRPSPRQPPPPTPPLSNWPTATTRFLYSTTHS